MAGHVIDEAIQRALRSVRAHLGLDVAFVSQFRGRERVFRYVDTDLEASGIEVGGSDPLEDSYCHHVVRGDLPGLLHDPAAHPLAAGLAVARRLPLGTHLIVPIRLSDGSVFGTCCCLGLDVDGALDARDLSSVRMMAGVIARYLDDHRARRERHEQRRERHERRRERLAGITQGRDLLMVFQPIVHLSRLEVVGFEALARFPTLVAGPAELFAEARDQGVEVELELKAVRAALEHVRLLPERAYLSVNVSPTTLADGELLRAIRSASPERLVVEITEHAAVQDYDRLLDAVEHLTDLGVRLAVDDVGMGISGLHHILKLSPHLIKIDGALVRGIHQSPPKQALISALVTFATRTGVALVAEGIEQAPELHALRVLGVGYGQGHHISRPSARLLVA